VVPDSIIDPATGSTKFKFSKTVADEGRLGYYGHWEKNARIVVSGDGFVRSPCVVVSPDFPRFVRKFNPDASDHVLRYGHQGSKSSWAPLTIPLTDWPTPVVSEGNSLPLDVWKIGARMSVDVQ
jgi:hypothetical protein